MPATSPPNPALGSGPPDMWAGSARHDTVLGRGIARPAWRPLPDHDRPAPALGSGNSLLISARLRTACLHAADAPPVSKQTDMWGREGGRARCINTICAGHPFTPPPHPAFHHLPNVDRPLDTTHDTSTSDRRRRDKAALMGLKLQYNFYGRGKPLRWAIAAACQLAFVLFGVSLRASSWARLTTV